MRKSTFWKMLAALLLIMIMNGGGGCGSGGSDSANSGSDLRAKIAVLGELPEDQKKLLSEAGIAIVDYDSEEDIPILITNEALVDVFVDGVDPDAYARHGYPFGPAELQSAGRVAVISPDKFSVIEIHSILGRPFGPFKVGFENYDEVDFPPVLFYGLRKTEADPNQIFVQYDSAWLTENEQVSFDVIDVVSADACPGIEDGEVASDDSSGDAIEAQTLDPLGDYVDFREWLLEDSDMAEKSLNASKALSAVAQAQGDSPDLGSIASSYTATLSANPWGKSMKINVFIQAAHHFGVASGDMGKDWYYVYQECLLDGSGKGGPYEYKKAVVGAEPPLFFKATLHGKVYYVMGSALQVAQDFISQYAIADDLLLGGASSGAVVLSDSKPEAYNNVTTVTVGSNSSVNEAAAAGGGGTGALSNVLAVTNFIRNAVKPMLLHGYTQSKSMSYQTYDVTVKQFIQNSVSPRWQYDFKLPGLLEDAVELSRSVYKPCQTWIWGIDTKEREKINKFRLSLDVTDRSNIWEAKAVDGNGENSLVERRGISWKANTITQDISLPQPPLMGFSTNTVTYGKQAGTPRTPVEIQAEGGWTADIPTGYNWDWYTVSQANDKLYITFKENTTGATRQGVVRVTRANSTDVNYIVVTQVATALVD
ncbi:MAG: BACON domain-containing protein [Synergistaceae bacterium]|jgi:hypothetical protein|nr:BACON domain-containing protein [Synergistaceae bacterium]